MAQCFLLRLRTRLLLFQNEPQFTKNRIIFDLQCDGGIIGSCAEPILYFGYFGLLSFSQLDDSVVDIH